MHSEVKDESRVLFWHDVWCGCRLLKTQFPSLFRMARHKNATVLDVVSWNGNVYHWDLSFVRSLNDWEEDTVWSMLALLASKEVLPQGNDVIVWPFNSKGSFSVKSFCSTQVEVMSGWDGAAKAISNSNVFKHEFSL